MNTQIDFPKLTSTGTDLDLSTVDWLQDSSDALDDANELRLRMDERGYLFVKGLLNRGTVLDARRSVCERLAADAYLDLSRDPMDAVWARDKLVKFKPDYATGNPRIEALVYGPDMLGFFDRFFGKPTLHYDFTWLRTVCPGAGTPSHCDIVYMGRGEREQLYTCWTPLGDIGFARGGLCVLEGSHKFDPLKQSYGAHDVDSSCTNKPGDEGWSTERNWFDDFKSAGNNLGNNPNHIRNVVGGTWRTGEFEAGDALIFSMYTVHASLDNSSDRIRLSTDSRYQPSGTVQDERWVGSNPIGHSKAGKRGRIC